MKAKMENQFSKFFTTRRFRGYSLRTKLIMAFVVIIVLGLGISGWLSQRSYQISQTDEIGDKLARLADTNGVQVAITLKREIDILKTLALSKEIQNAAQVASETSTLSQVDIDRLDRRWQSADAAGNNNDPLVAGVLNNPISDELRSFQSQFKPHVEVFLTGTQGFNIASTNRTSDYNQADEEWWQTAYGLGQYVGQPEYDESSKTIAINMAVAVRENGTGKVLGVLRTTVDLTSLGEILTAGRFGRTGHMALILKSGQMLLLKDTGAGNLEMVQEEAPPELLALYQSSYQYQSKYQNVHLNGIPVLLSIAKVKTFGNTTVADRWIWNLSWYVVTLQDEAEALQPVTAQARYAIILGVLLMFIGIIVAIVISRAISGPVIRLTAAAEKVAAGDLTANTKVETQDEIGTLANTFNNMTSQLRELIGSLEQRVAERTKALAAVAEIGTATATILNANQLLQEVVDLTKERFNLYHSHIYLLDDTGENLVLASGAGEPGRQMKAKGLSIPLDREQSLVARAAREKKGVIVNDVTQAPDFLPNSLLPDTRSELAVPMIVGENVIGVFDVQSDVTGRFTDADIAVQTTLASQIASAVQNARLYTQAEISKQEAQSLVKYASEAILVVDLDTGNFAEPNESAAKLYGLPDEELVKVGPAQMSPPRQPDGRDSTEKAMEKIGEAMQGGAPIFEWMHRNAQGQDFLCEIRLVRLPGEHPRVRATVTDISERKRLEELTVQRARQQESINLITQKIQSATSIETALQVAARELGHALGQKQTLVALDAPALADDRKEN